MLQLNALRVDCREPHSRCRLTASSPSSGNLIVCKMPITGNAVGILVYRMPTQGERLLYGYNQNRRSPIACRMPFPGATLCFLIVIAGRECCSIDCREPHSRHGCVHPFFAIFLILASASSGNLIACKMPITGLTQWEYMLV
jgi:hypothetical protein